MECWLARAAILKLYTVGGLNNRNGLSCFYEEYKFKGRMLTGAIHLAGFREGGVALCLQTAVHSDALHTQVSLSICG